MHRRDFRLATTVAALAAPRVGMGAKARAAPTELTLMEIAAGFADGRLTSRRLTQFYLDRISALDRNGPKLGAVLETNPQALDIAAELDRERLSHGVRGPLHGAPVLIKDNIETADRMMTTAGSLALEGWYAPKDAPLSGDECHARALSGATIKGHGLVTSGGCGRECDKAVGEIGVRRLKGAQRFPDDFCPLDEQFLRAQ